MRHVTDCDYCGEIRLCESNRFGGTCCSACAEGDCDEVADDGQPSEYEEWQDFYGGDDWDHGQYDSCEEW